METTIVYWGYTGVMAKTMETTIVNWGHIVAILGEWTRKWKPYYIGVMLWLYWGIGKENGNYCS